MDYIYGIAIAAGGIWTGYLVGQFVSIKDTNIRLNAYARERQYWLDEMDRMADVIARYQAKKPERDNNGKFTSRKARVTAELQAYVASKKAVL